MKSTIRKRGKYWHYDNNRKPPGRIRRSLSTPSHAKARQLQKRLDRIYLQNPWDERLLPRKVSISRHAAEFIEYVYQIKSPSWAARQHSTVRNFLARVPDKDVHEFTPSDIEGYIKKRSEEGMSPNTIRIEMVVVKRLFERAVRDGVVDKNPAGRVELPKARQVRPIRPFSKEEMEIIFRDHFRPGMGKREKAAARNRYPVMATLWYTGLRISDVISMTTEEVDLEAGTYQKHIKKTGRNVLLPIAEPLVEILGPLIPSAGPVFPNYYPGDSVRRSADVIRNLNTQLYAILKRNDIPHGSLHSIRHGFNQELFKMGLGILDRQALLAHAAAGTTQIYTHPDEDLARSYLNRLRID
ncbi:MAG: tyrosine-type recombinase/integrase [Candidatus Brocadiales bacterium]|nr:tyrosine-type recombinase/integrase [Candidatus Bathyanammoxibius sp.]